MLVNGVDPAAVAARVEREREMNDRVDAAAAARLADLEARGKKECANWKVCAAEIEVTANKCEWCGKNQPSSVSGQLSGTNRGRIRQPIVFRTNGGPR